MRRLSCIINSYESEEEERIWKSSKLAGCPEAFVCERILEIAGLVECFPVIEEIPRCSDILVCRWRVVWPTYDAEQHRHLNKYTTLDLRYLGTLSLKGKKEEIRLEERKTNLMSRWGKAALQRRLIWVRICRECIPENVSKYLRSSVVYLFKCRCCSASYVGQTTRHLHIRISEHLGISPITGKHSTNPAISSILSHTNASGHPANFDDFQILSSSSDSYELMIHESLLINKYRPNLNVQGSSIPLNLF